MQVGIYKDVCVLVKLDESHQFVMPSAPPGIGAYVHPSAPPMPIEGMDATAPLLPNEPGSGIVMPQDFKEEIPSAPTAADLPPFVPHEVKTKLFLKFVIPLNMMKVNLIHFIKHTFMQT